MVSTVGGKKKVAVFDTRMKKLFSIALNHYNMLTALRVFHTDLKLHVHQSFLHFFPLQQTVSEMSSKTKPHTICRPHEYSARETFAAEDITGNYSAVPTTQK